MIARHFTITIFVSLLLSAASAIAWIATLRVTFEDQRMPGPGFYIVTSKPWLGWLSLIFLPVAMGFLIISKRQATIREERIKRGRCIHCDYSLTANTSGVCPECGTPVHNSSEAAV